LTDCVVNANIGKVLACYDNLELLDKLMPEFYDLEWKKKVTDCKGMMYGKQKFPWPLWHRDLIFHVTGTQDYDNKAVLSLSKSMDEGQNYHGVDVPEVPYGLVRLEAKMGFNYF